jgi:DNA-binding transcriptional MerR regulator/methylmalonyl-CoA mutase cobalamin-binding subunit
LPETLYTLSQVAELADIPSQTIYTWERRHDAIVPSRTLSGRRAYTGSQLLRLKLLKACVDQGGRIGTIARLSDASLHDLLNSARKPNPAQTALIHHAIALEQDELDARIGVSLVSLGPAVFADETLSQLMDEIGHRWRSQLGAIATEHLIATSAKSILFAALRLSRPRVSRGTAIFATPDGELHELGLLAAAVTAQSCGIRALYLGPQVPVAELQHAVEASGARFVVISSSILATDVVLPVIADIRTNLAEHVKILVGGHTFGENKRKMPRGILVFDSLRDYEEHLASDSLWDL